MIYLSGCINPHLPNSVGVILTPMGGHKLPENRIWASDTGCFAKPNNHSDTKYLAWLAKHRENAHRCLFATAPDVWGNAEATFSRAIPMLEPIRQLGYKAALVVQDGMTVETIPWEKIDAVFIGGTNPWRASNEVIAICKQAKSLGLWLHMGRVNSLRRMRTAVALGCDSTDGTFVAFGPDKNIPRLQRMLELLDAQMRLGI